MYEEVDWLQANGQLVNKQKLQTYISLSATIFLLDFQFLRKSGFY